MTNPQREDRRSQADAAPAPTVVSALSRRTKRGDGRGAPTSAAPTTAANAGGVSSARGQSYTHGSADIRKQFYGSSSNNNTSRSSTGRSGASASYYEGATAASQLASEPIYIDLMESPPSTGPRRLSERSVAQNTTSPNAFDLPYYDDDRETATFSGKGYYGGGGVGNMRRPQGRAGYGVYATPAKPASANTATTTPGTKEPQPMPVMYGDPMDTGSVNTGMSQQELLRKKAREDNHRRRSKDKHHSNRKSKKHHQILNMPVNLVVGAGKKVQDMGKLMTEKKKSHSKVRLKINPCGPSSKPITRSL